MEFRFFVFLASGLTFGWLKSEKVVSDVVKDILLKNIDIHSLNLPYCVSIVVFDVETDLENAKLVTRIKNFLRPLPTMVEGWFCGILQKPKCHLYFVFYLSDTTYNVTTNILHYIFYYIHKVCNTKWNDFVFCCQLSTFDCLLVDF